MLFPKRSAQTSDYYYFRLLLQTTDFRLLLWTTGITFRQPPHTSDYYYFRLLLQTTNFRLLLLQTSYRPTLVCVVYGKSIRNES